MVNKFITILIWIIELKCVQHVVMDTLFCYGANHWIEIDFLELYFLFFCFSISIEYQMELSVEYENILSI